MNPDQEKWKKLVKEIKDVNGTFDHGVRQAVFGELANKKLSYFLSIFATDDGLIDDDEYELLAWLMDDLYVTDPEDEYVRRITNMMR